MQAGELTATKPGVGRHPRGGEEAVIGDVVQELPELLGVPRSGDGTAEGPTSGRVGDLGRVGDDQPTAHSVVERPPQDLVDLEDGLGVEATATDMVAIGRERGVEPFDVVRPKMSKRDPADAGDDVESDVAVIAGPGGRPQPGLVGQIGRAHV